MVEERLLTRRQTIKQMAGVTALAMFSLYGCGGLFGGGGAGSVNLSSGVVGGTIDLPLGVSIPSLTVQNLFTAPVAPVGGAFSFVAVRGAPLVTCALADPQTPVLYGFLSDEVTVLSSASTALVLAFFALGAQVQLPEVQLLYLEALGQPGVLDPLAAAIETSIQANGAGWLAVDDAGISNALLQVMSEIGPQPGPQAGRSLGAIIDPTERTSGLQLQADGAGTATLTNYFRRRVYLYTDREYYYTKAGEQIVSAAHVEPQPLVLPAVDGLSGANPLVVLAQLGGGTADYYDPVTTPKIPVPVYPNDSSTAYTHYTVTAVGIGLQTGDLNSVTQTQLEGYFEASVETMLLDVVLPMIANIILPLNAQVLNSLLRYALASALLKDLVTGVIELGNVKNDLQQGQAAAAVQEAVFGVVNSISLRNKLLQMFVRWLKSGVAGVPQLGEQAIQDFAVTAAGTLLRSLSVLNIALQSFDTIVLGCDWARSQCATIFTLDVTKAIAKLNPSSTQADSAGVPVSLTADVANADVGQDTILSYTWSCPCQFGDISDGIHTNGQNGNTFDSSSKNLSYVPNGKGIGGDIDKITVKIFEGPINNRTPIGEASAIVTINPVDVAIAPANDHVDLSASETFTVTVNARESDHATYEWTLAGGHGSIGTGAVVKTSSPSIGYTAGNKEGDDTLSVKVMGPDGVLRATGSTTITVQSQGTSSVTYTVDVPDNSVVTITHDTLPGPEGRIEAGTSIYIQFAYPNDTEHDQLTMSLFLGTSLNLTVGQTFDVSHQQPSYLILWAQTGSRLSCDSSGGTIRIDAIHGNVASFSIDATLDPVFADPFPITGTGTLALPSGINIG